MSEQVTGAALVCRVLGELAVRGQDGTWVEISAEKPRLLLAELLLHPGEWVSTDSLTEALWATPPASARGNLKTYVHQLRQVLPEAAGTGRLISRRGGYRLAVTAEEIDAGAFAALLAEGKAALHRGDADEAIDTLRAALALWAGEPYDRIAGPAAELEAGRLRELRKTTLERLADALLAAGEPAEAAALLRPATSADPLREPTWQRLITALRADGRPADALAAYEQLRRTLVTELGAEPSQELRTLHRQLLAETGEETPATTVRPQPPAPERGPSRWRKLALLSAVLVLVAGVVLIDRMVRVPASTANAEGATPGAAAMSTDAVLARRSVPGYPAAPGAAPKLLFGLGSQAPKAAESPLRTSADIGMLTTWFDNPDEMSQYEAWSEQVIPDLYRSGTALHLVVPSWDEPRSVPTRYGQACGQPYPLSAAFLTDMRRLATAFAGRADGPPLYVSMFHGLEKLACSELGYDVNPLNRNYYRALKDRYLDVLRIFHEHAPNARVGLNWDGWEATHDDRENGDGRSMFGYFAEEMNRSDFVGFNAFEPDENVVDVRDSVRELGKYAPVMLSYYKPYGAPAQASRTLLRDLRAIFTDRNMRTLTEQGLFAWSFTDDQLPTANRQANGLVNDVLERYGRAQGAAG